MAPIEKNELVRELQVQKERIAELTEIVAALRKTEEKYRSIFEEAIEGIFQTSVEGRFIAANPSLARIHGYDSPHELIQSIYDISEQLYVHPEDRLRLVERLNRYGSATDFETEMYSRNGDIHWISMNIRTVKDTDGDTRYYEGTMLDITERKRAEASLHESE
ncbi:MAG: PAS domain S-box protein [Syntrophorhabdaceae bacterium]